MPIPLFSISALYLSKSRTATTRWICTKWLCGCVFLVSGCENFEAAPVNFTQDDIVAVGEVQTLELHGRVISSLPATPPVVDPARAELGRLLFWDPILSGDRDVACATCHLPEHAYTDGQHQSIGVGGSGRGVERIVGHTGRVPRNAQTVLNTAWNGINELGLFDPETAPMFWDNRTLSLTQQALEPIESLQEMRGDVIPVETILTEIENRLNTIPAYRELFSSAFGVQTITRNEVALALANFQMILVANNAPFDRWMRGEADAMTAEEISGMQEFVLAGCADCHSGPLFSDFETRILGISEGIDVTEPDSANGDFAFRTPTLRQLAQTGPYFHAGQSLSLRNVLDFYDEPRRSENPNVPSSSLDSELLQVPETDNGLDTIIRVFLRTLNDPDFDQREPESVPSGLTPGGFD